MSVTLSSPYGYIEFFEDGSVWSNYAKDTSGQVLPDVSDVAFSFSNPGLYSRVPWLVSMSRTSPDVVRPGETISVDWQVKDLAIRAATFQFRGVN